MQQCHIKGRENPGNWASFPLSWAGHYLQSRTGGHRGCIVCAGDCCFGVPQGQSRISPAFQRWVGRRKVASPEGTAEVQSHAPSFSRPFGTFLPCGMFPGVKTPGYSQDVPPDKEIWWRPFPARKQPDHERCLQGDFAASVPRHEDVGHDHAYSVQREKCGTCSAPWGRGQGCGRAFPLLTNPIFGVSGSEPALVYREI